MAPNRDYKEQTGLLLTCLFLWEVSIGVMAMVMSVNGDRALTLFLASRAAWIFLTALGTAGLTTAVIVRQYVVSRRVGSHHFRLVVAMNLMMVLAILLTGEMAVRLGTSGSTEGVEKWRWRVLMPKSWEKVALFHRQLLDQGSGQLALSLWVYDDLMGWTVGPNRESSNSLYYSSSEGIRAPQKGVSYVKHTDKTRIALVGDSFTFAENVAYEHSWGYLLEKALGSEFEVLNFGVGGYGVDQAYLRYEKDVRPWKPKVVIFGFISDDAERSMVLYHSLSRPEWFMPYSKPRFVSGDKDLKKLNVPPITPQELFARGSISELPYLEYDRGYRPSDWQSSWVHHSYLVRVFMTLFPHWEVVTPDVSDAALVSVNAAILKAFAQSATSEGSIPLLGYFPESNVEIDQLSGPLPLGKKVLREAGMAYTDLTPCLMPLNPAERFGKYAHYSRESNARVAQCLSTVVHDALAMPSR